MEPSRADGGEAACELVLDEWRVQPSLNRLARGATTVRLEPKLMDVLVFLARHAGQVVSKDDIADAVWPGLFMTESVITRAIAGLRRALEDDARTPRFIETITKRGYRLLVAPAAARASSPYSVGQWVRGERFFGRAAEIAEILDGPRNGIWLLGGRQIGKTSLLKQLELLTANEAKGRYFPLFWDLQGSAEPGDLDGDFAAALSEAEDRLDALGLPLADVSGGDFLASLGRLRRALRSRGRTLLLLWDEVEELVHLHAQAPSLLRKLRRALQSQEGVRTVMASGPRLWKLAEQRDDTSPFLHGFAPPLPLGPLADVDARALVGQGAAGIADEILRQCANHPGLLQLLSARTVELGDLERATASVSADPAVRFFFAVDFDLLTPAEQGALLAVARGEGGADAAPERPALERLGLVRRGEGGRLEVASPLRRSWLLERADQKV